MNPSLRRYFRQAWLRELLLAALLLQALLPAGFMPGVDANGRATLTLCAFYGPVPHAAGDHAPDGSGTSDHADQGPCLFTAVLHAAPLPGLVTYGPPPPGAQSLPAARFVPPYLAVMPSARLARGPPTQA